MDSESKLSIETIEAIDALTTDLRAKPPFLVRIITVECLVLGTTIRTQMTRMPRIYRLSEDEKKLWLEHQRFLNKTMREYQDLLEKYVKASTSKASTLRLVKFRFGLKKKLSRISANMDIHRNFFFVMVPELLSRVPEIPPPQQHNHQSSRVQDPVMSIDQFVRLQLDKEAGLREVQNSAGLD